MLFFVLLIHPQFTTLVCYDVGIPFISGFFFHWKFSSYLVSVCKLAKICSLLLFKTPGLCFTQNFPDCLPPPHPASPHTSRIWSTGVSEFSALCADYHAQKLSLLFLNCCLGGTMLFHHHIKFVPLFNSAPPLYP